MGDVNKKFNGPGNHLGLFPLADGLDLRRIGGF